MHYLKDHNTNNMSATFHTHAKPSAPEAPAAKKAKTEPVPTGIGLIIRSRDDSKASGAAASPPEVLVMDGDRTRKDPAIWDPWSSEFHAGEPHNIYMVALKDGLYEPLYVPGNAHKTGEAHQYTAQECGRAMLKHAFAKKWIAKCVGNEAYAEGVVNHIKNIPKNEKGKADKKAIKAYAAKLVDALDDTKVQAFLDLCVKYTKLALVGDSTGRSYLLTEVVMGGIERGHTADQTAVKEGFEESRAPKEFLEANIESKGIIEFVNAYTGRSSWSATYTCSAAKADIEGWWQGEEQRRKALTNWFCAHGWFSNLPGIDDSAMESLKGLCETRNGRWVSVEQALAILDTKSLNVFKHVLSH